MSVFPSLHFPSLLITAFLLQIAFAKYHHRVTPVRKHHDHDHAVTTQLTDTKEGSAIYKRKAVHAHDGGASCHHFSRLNYESEAQKRACKKSHHDIEVAVDDTNRSKRDGGAYKLVKQYSGSTFFDTMSFYTHADPTGGMIEYVDEQEARQDGLIGLRNGHAFMHIGAGGNGLKKSVRITTKDSFTTGVFILDAVHMPTGCGVWPSFWTTPSDPVGGWPSGGEIDVIEGVHYFSRNMQSIHAPSTCHLPQSIDMLGKLADPDKTMQRNCDPHVTDDQGCGIQSQEDGDYGVQYNKGGGGVHAMVWDEQDGIKVFFFARNQIPEDIARGRPDPSGWGTPRGSWPADGCNPTRYFSSHVAVFTNTVCGTWAGSSQVWNNAGAGQTESCAKITGKSSCYEYVLADPALPTAYWEIKSLTIYQTSRRT